VAWIELHETIKSHRKTYALMGELKVKKQAAIGILVMLWTWTLNAAEDGDLSAFPPRAIADAVEWQKSPEKLIEALVSSGWLDRDEEGVRIHDWYDYAGRLIERRAEKRAYKKRKFALYNDLRLTRAVKARDGDHCRYCGITVNWGDKKGSMGGTYDYVDPNGANSVDNIVVTCRSCYNKKEGRTLTNAKMTLLPVPTDNRQITGEYPAKNSQEKSAITVPYRTVPNIDDDDEGARRQISNAYEEHFGKNPTPAIEDSLVRWLKEFPVETICEAVHRAALVNASSPCAYVYECLRNWQRAGRITLIDVQGAEADRDMQIGRL
jgi:DnaD/phage-associated family protein